VESAADAGEGGRLVLYLLFSLSGTLTLSPAARTEKATNTSLVCEGRFSHLLYVVAAGEKIANCTQVIWTRHGGYQNAARAIRYATTRRTVRETK
jgi:hypothetical protein